MCYHEFMKKKFVVIFITSLLLSGCASASAGDTDTPTEISADEVFGEMSDTSVIKEAEALPDAEITIPAGLVGSEISDCFPEADLHDSNAHDAGSDIVATPHEDGSVTYSLTGEERATVINKLSSEITDSIKVILDDDDHYPNIESITPNEDVTCFTIALTDGQMNQYESMLVMSFYTIGNKYQLYNGIPSDKVLTTVVYINSSNNEVVSETDSSSLDGFSSN